MIGHLRCQAWRWWLVSKNMLRRSWWKLGCRLSWRNIRFLITSSWKGIVLEACHVWMRLLLYVDSKLSNWMGSYLGYQVRIISVHVNTCLDEDPMPVLEILQNAYIGRQMVIQHNAFRWLKVLRIGVHIWTPSQKRLGWWCILGSLRWLLRNTLQQRLKNSSITSNILEVDIISPRLVLPSSHSK